MELPVPLSFGSGRAHQIDVNWTQDVLHIPAVCANIYIGAMDISVLLALAIISFMLLCALTVLWVICWGIHTVRDNSRLAALYRAGAQAAQPTGPSYTMVYKSNRKQEAIRIMASTEQEALALAHKNNIRYDVIVSLTKD